MNTKNYNWLGKNATRTVTSLVTIVALATGLYSNFKDNKPRGVIPMSYTSNDSNDSRDSKEYLKDYGVWAEKYFVTDSNETLESIARKKGVNPKSLKSYNPDVDPNKLSSGQKIIIGPEYKGRK